MFHPASAASVQAFLGICIVVVALFLGGVWKSARAGTVPPFRRVGVAAGALGAWLALDAVLVARGWVGAAPPHLMIFGAVNLLLALMLGLSPMGGRLANGCSIAALLAFQGFRLPLELVLHSWVQQGVIPGTMTWTGSNWDIVSGILALVLAPFGRRSAAAAWVGNLVGLALLLNVIRVAARSAPGPFSWADVQPKLLLPLHLPYALIVPVCVGGALAGHVVLTRALLRPTPGTKP